MAGWLIWAESSRESNAIPKVRRVTIKNEFRNPIPIPRGLTWQEVMFLDLTFGILVPLTFGVGFRTFMLHSIVAPHQIPPFLPPERIAGRPARGTSQPGFCRI